MNDDLDLGPKSPHAFMAEALDAKARLLKLRRSFLRDAALAEAAALQTRLGLAGEDVDHYFEALAAEQSAHAPRLKPWRG
jgi:hypothetical protein